ncbi:uncharacterized protein LTR77_006806 [Saxophila tyrrhenica]|uniref:Clr5 domain-containing protein n=1 Tax=Saxophila tyrrhenica TaxID=1690608 RepID=A0AAV9P7W5_9PEZI|nr:hypothetical protein LTR77_006806 [Saxophila tyrrhenica]
MTKSWKDVKQEACHLYTQGATLLQVQAKLEQKYQFRASTRAFRGKFKEWGVTRSSQLVELKARNARMPRVLGGAELSYEMPEATIVGRSHSEPLGSEVFQPASRGTNRPSYLDDHASRHPWLEHDASTQIVDQFEFLYHELRQAETGPEISEILNRTRFVSGEDCILHYTAAKAELWALDYLMDYINIKDISIDLENSRRRTALEYAILAGQKFSVELLLANGASVDRRNSSEQQPLHCAVQSLSPDICVILLEHGANANAPLAVKQQYRSSLDVTFEQLSKAQMKEERDKLARIFEILLTNGADVADRGSESEVTQLEFLKRWYQQDPRSFQPSHYLRNNFHPLCWISRKLCPVGACGSLASYIFSHTPGSGLARLLIQTVDVENHGDDLLHAMLSPCIQQATTNWDPTTYELFHELLERMHARGVKPRKDPFILHRIWRDAPHHERLLLIESAQRSALATAEESRMVLVELGPEDGNFGLDMAESLMSQPEVVSAQLWNELVVHYYGKSGMFRRSFSVADEGFHHEIQLKIFTALGLDLQQAAGAEEHVVRSTMHVFTKRLLEGKIPGHNISAQQRVFGVTPLREKYDLPELPVPSSMILEMNSHIHRGRVDVLSAEQGSDYYSSPGTTMSDGHS